MELQSKAKSSEKLIEIITEVRISIQGVCKISDTKFPDFSKTFFWFSLTLDQHFVNFFPGIHPLKIKNLLNVSKF